MISADLEHLGLPHEMANIARSLMLQELHGAGALLLPLVLILVKPVKLQFVVINEKTSINRTNQWKNSEIGKKKGEKWEKERALQIQNCIFVFLAGGDNNLLELDDWSDVSFGVLVIANNGASSSSLLRLRTLEGSVRDNIKILNKQILNKHIRRRNQIK